MAAPAPKQWDTAYEAKIILILSLAFGLVGLDRFILPVLFPSMQEELGLSLQQLGTLVGILAVAWGVTAFAMGYASDRLGRRKVLVPAVVLFSLLSALSGMATGFLSLLLIRMIMGAAEGPAYEIVPLLKQRNIVDVIGGKDMTAVESRAAVVRMSVIRILRRVAAIVLIVCQVLGPGVSNVHL